MAIRSFIRALTFGIASAPPAAPETGRKLFISEKGEMSMIDPTGAVTSLSAGKTNFYLTKSLFPQPGQTPAPLLDRLYVAEDELTAYKWTGTAYVQLKSSLDAGVY